MPQHNDVQLDQQESAGGDAATKTIAGAQTLERGLELLELAVQEPMRMTELMRSSGMTRSVVYRLVAALTARGFLVVSGDGRVRGGSKLLQLGHLTAVYNDIVPIATPHLDELAMRTGLSAFLGRRDGDFSVHLLRSAGTERIAVTTQPGTRRLLPETGLGKALLLEDDMASWTRLFALADGRFKHTDWQQQMQESKAAGAVLQRGPAPDLINSVAAPVRDASGRVIAAINVAAAAQYLDLDRMKALMPLVLETARTISQEMGAA